MEVFSFGSVPLKTYLPDGDIDLTALTNQSIDENLATKLCNALRDEVDSEFHVTDVQYIEAQVDQLIGKDHLFKRSIILIKAWCYYQSRMLGAHHGLISTYALETMVLYIINRFHASMRGPLEVLYTFLEYYSRFDWDTDCVSISGPIAISSLTEITETSGDDANELLLHKEFLKNCQDIFSGSTREDENKAQEFPIRYLNILDPLNENNNLGRSVNKGSFHRIIGAFSYGAQKLGEILTLPGEHIGEALEKFFATTLDRNGRGERPDVQVPVPAFGTGRSEESDLGGDYSNYYSGLVYGQCYCRSLVSMQPSLIPAQVWNNYFLDAPTQLVQNNWNLLYQSGADFSPQRIPFCYPNPSQLPAVNLSMEKCGRSRGTGTYIPEMTYPSAKDRYKRERKRFPNYPRYDYLPKSAQGNGSIGVAPESSGSGNSSSLDLSLKEFPLLAHSQSPIPSEIHKYDQQAAVIFPIKQSSPSSGNINFGTYRGSSPPLGLPTHVAIKQADSYDVAQKHDLVDAHAESDGAVKSNNFDFSLEEFPLLAGSTSKAQQSDQLAAKNLQVKKNFPAFGFANNDAGTYGDSSSLWRLPSQAASERADSHVPYLLGSAPTVSATGVSNQDSSEGNKETSLMQPYQLEDDQEFPPLM